MKEALSEAEKAFEKGEVPVGAVVVKGGEIIGRGHNLRETLKSPIRHAEIVAIEEACLRLGDWRLEGCDVYVTLEPCIMCCGALLQARVARLFFGAYDPKGGAAESLYRLLSDERLNHRVKVFGGIMEAECAALLKRFFEGKR